jgi:hypothetical protein
MNVWDEFKDFVSNLNLVKVQNELLKGGKLQVFIGGKHYHVEAPPSTNMTRVGSTEVTPDKQKQFLRYVGSSVYAERQARPDAPLEEASKTVAKLTLLNAVKLLDPEADITDDVEVEDVPEVDIEEPEEE